ncbi:MAG TPA: hypothetical protein VGO66_10480 [Solirubrobacterales bacterium]|jgi:hypothetical protein|nr:hypothetical protein [Solirubrobacterales bacterium]
MAETKAKKAQGKKRTSGSASKAKSKAGGSNGSGAESLAGSVKNGAQGAIEGVGPILQKAKLPLLAGGAAVAGVAGAVLASRSGGRRKVLGVAVPKRSKKLSLPKRNGLKSDARKVTGAVADAAKRADDFGQGVSRIASSVRKVGETADEAVKKS